MLSLKTGESEHLHFIHWNARNTKNNRVWFLQFTYQLIFYYILHISMNFDKFSFKRSKLEKLKKLPENVETPHRIYASPLCPSTLKCDFLIKRKACLTDCSDVYIEVRL